MNDDLTLVRAYADGQSEDAFTALVDRYIALVYSAALRQTRDPHQAREITQVVFIILARKAGTLHARTVLPGWLYHTTHYVAANLRKTDHHRRQREQEAYMDTLAHAEPDPTWEQLSPALDEAMAHLRDQDRDAIVLRFFENKSLREVGASLGIADRAAQKRIARGLEKLRAFFTRRGILTTTAILGSALATNSVHAAPAGLAQSISAVALVKGAAASTSTLTLVKGALKIMAWTKTQTAIAVGMGLLLAAGTTTVTVREVQRLTNTDSQWDKGRVDSQILQTAPHIVRIIPTKFPHQGGWAGEGNGRVLGLGIMPMGLIGAAYGEYTGARTVYLTKLPQKKYDFIANLPSGSGEALQREIEKQFGVVARYETIETNVLFLRVNTSTAPGLRPTTTRYNSSSSQNWGEYHVVNMRLAFSFDNFLEGEFGIPVIDQTGLNKSYDINLKWKDKGDQQHNNLKQALNDQLGLELVPGGAPVKMLFVEKAQ
jgi:uncharacterized protein (TIGR03435 family)